MSSDLHAASAQYMPTKLRRAIQSIDDMIRRDVTTKDVGVVSAGILYDQQLIWSSGYGTIDNSSYPIPSSYAPISHNAHLRCMLSSPAL